MKHTFLFALLTMIVMGVFYACTKSAAETSTSLRINMTDNPYDAQEVNVEVKEIRVNYQDESEWSVLQTNSGIYNLLSLQNGIDTLVATGTIPGSYVGEVRFVLGTQNSIKIDDVVYPLTIPGGSESGLKLKVNRKLKKGTDSLLVDFDAALSVHQTGNGTYILRPVLKLK